MGCEPKENSIATRIDRGQCLERPVTKTPDRLHATGSTQSWRRAGHFGEEIIENLESGLAELPRRAHELEEGGIKASQNSWIEGNDGERPPRNSQLVSRSPNMAARRAGRLIMNGELSDDDIRALTEICKGEHGLAEKTEVKPLSKEHVPDRDGTAAAVSLESIFDHKGVNALAEDQTLKFALMPWSRGLRLFATADDNTSLVQSPN